MTASGTYRVLGSRETGFFRLTITQPSEKVTPSPTAPDSSASLERCGSPDRRELRIQANDLALRVAAARRDLASVQRQLAAQRLGLRADILEADVHISLNMKQANDALATGDIDSARTHLEAAQKALELIERFLGH